MIKCYDLLLYIWQCFVLYFLDFVCKRYDKSLQGIPTNEFVNENHHEASSSTCHIPTNDSTPFNFTPRPHTASDMLDDEDSSDDYSSEEIGEYQKSYTLYNTVFAFTSPEMKIDNNQRGRGPPIIRIQGQTCHRIGSMLPFPGHSPKFSQLYIYDTDNEIGNRMQSFGNNSNILPDTVEKLKCMLGDVKPHAKSFRMEAERLKHCEFCDLKLNLIFKRPAVGRIYNQPTVSEVVALIVSDVDTENKRDIILERQSGRLKIISEFHPSYMACQ
ncbi:unnamed protein product [Lathyrus sativus]|nr:unnamed protein product [Lathyrus sativus]